MERADSVSREEFSGSLMLFYFVYAMSHVVIISVLLEVGHHSNLNILQWIVEGKQ